VVKRIPIWIRNTFARGQAGLADLLSVRVDHPVKGITSIDGVALVNVEGAGMIGVPGTAQRLFGALREDGISVILISQGSSGAFDLLCDFTGRGRAYRADVRTRFARARGRADSERRRRARVQHPVDRRATGWRARRHRGAGLSGRWAPRV
jgi:aspartokinase